MHGGFAALHVKCMAGLQRYMWSAWLVCSVTCGAHGGFAALHVECMAGLQRYMWSAWRVCSVTCESESRIRTGRCVNGVEGEQGCEGSFLQNESCRTNVSFVVL